MSAAPTAEVKDFVVRYQLTDYIQTSIGVDEGLSKPDPALFIHACQVLGVEAKHTLMVGDSVGDMQMARHAQAAGCIGITWIDKPDNVKGADVVIHRLDEIHITSQ